MDYDEWIEAWRTDHPRAAGLCARAVSEMVKAFPELQVVQGKALIPGVGGYTCFEYDPEALKEDRPPIWVPHWWCVSPDGEILDPTADQFTKVLNYVRDGDDPTLRELFASFPARVQFTEPVIARALKTALGTEVDRASLILDPDEEFPSGICQTVKVDASFEDLEGNLRFGRMVFAVFVEDGMLSLQVHAEGAEDEASEHQVH
jgi:hypothetical protein